MKTLKSTYADKFKIGAAVAASWLEEAADVVKAQFDTVTCENEMKYNGLHAGQQSLRFETDEAEVRTELIHPNKRLTTAGADKIYRFAEEEGLGVRGHTLAWHGSYPHGLFEQLSAEELEINLREYFSFVADRYPHCFCWDVVNEAIDDKHGQYLRETVFKEKLGEDYLYKIYGMAREYFPGRQLFCNDYNEFVPEKREKIIRLVTSLKERGLVDGIGCQAHIGIGMLNDPNAFDEMERTYEKYAALGLRIHVTELDVNTHAKEKDLDAARLNHQVAEVYGRMFALFRRYSEVIDSVTFWGVSDKYSWLNYFQNEERRPVYPLLFDRDFQPKEAYWRVVDF